jgi:putative ABC transport system permease protein
MRQLWQDVLYAGRTLRKSPSFTIFAVLTLTLGIGANTVIFGVVNAVALHPLPYKNPQQLVIGWETDSNRKITHGTTPPADFLDWRSQSHSFQEMAAYQAWFFNLTTTEEPEQVPGADVSPGFFNMLGVRLPLGRTFSAEEEQPGNNNVVILSHEIWVRDFGSDPEIIGRSILVDKKPFTVIGVLPSGFDLLGYNQSIDLWMPLSFAPKDIRRDNPSLIVFGRLKNGVNLAQANADLGTIASRLAMTYPATNQGTGALVVSMHDPYKSFGDPFLLLLAVVGLVLLIACANVANLMLSRSVARQREVAIRSALGAGRMRLVRQLLTESILLGLLGGALGLLLAFGGFHLMPLILPPAGTAGGLPHQDWIGVNLHVLIFTVIIAVLAGIIFGLAPAFQFSKPDLNEFLKEGGRGATGGRQSRATRNFLVIVEVALSVILLIGAGTLIRSFEAMLTQDIGFNPRNVLSFQIWLPTSRYPSSIQVSNFYQQAIEKMQHLPGVASAGAVNFLPLTGWTDVSSFDIDGRSAPSPSQQFVANYRVVDARFFQTMQIPLVRGRYFTDADAPDSLDVAIINETLAKQYWSGGNPIGQRVRLSQANSAPYWPAAGDKFFTIVGVVGDMQDRDLGKHALGELYFPNMQAPSRIMRIVLRTTVPPGLLAEPARKVVFSLDKDQPVTDVMPMEHLLSQSMASAALNTQMLTMFAVLALVLAAVGIYGVISYGVQQRTHEIGVRIALGAQRGDVIRLIVGEGARLAAVGVVLGLVGAYLLTTLLAGFLFGVKTVDIPSSAIAIAVLGVVAVSASYVPARRATRVDPLNALRYE